MRRAAFSEMEFIIAVLVAAALIFVCVPLFTSTAVKGQQTQALSNAKGIALTLRLYAGDHNGAYPSYTLSGGNPTSTPVRDSNTAFAQLFPTYLQIESIFWVKKSRFCNPKPPDDIFDTPALDKPVETLKSGENEWAYVLQLKDNSNPAVPLLASGFFDPVLHTYSTNPRDYGGLWKGVKAIVIQVDSSGMPMTVDRKTLTVQGLNGAGATQGDIFTTANGANGWLQPENVVVNPK